MKGMTEQYSFIPPEDVFLLLVEDFTIEVDTPNNATEAQVAEVNAKNKSKKLKLKEGIIAICTMQVMQRGDKRNKNGRIYPIEILSRETKKLSVLANKRALYMGADHPDYLNNYDIGFDNAAAITTVLKMDESTGIVSGSADIMDTECGRKVHKILKARGQVGVSSRGWGTSREGTHKGKFGNVKGRIMQDDLDMQGYDFVLRPSVRGASVSSSVIEGKQNGEKRMDSKQLKEEYPDLHKNLVEEGRLVGIQEATEKFKNQEADVKKQTLAEAVKQKVLVEKERFDATVAENEDLKKQVIQLTEDKGQLKAQIDEHDKQARTAEAKAVVHDLLASHPYRELIESRLSDDDLANPEKAKEKIESELEFMSKLNIPSPPNVKENEGRGKVQIEEDGEQDSDDLFNLKIISGIVTRK